jgi:uncharacterized delta-60 repeat protein
MYKRSITKLLPVLIALLSCFATGIALAATTLDESFAPVLATPGAITKIAPLPDGRIVIIGAFTSISGVPRSKIARLNVDGSVDGAFQMTGDIQVNRIDSVAVQSDGKILVGGQLTYYGQTASKNYLFRLNTDGSWDTTFDAGGYVYADSATYGLNGSVTTITVQSDGKILVGGEFSAPTKGIARLNSDGSRDTGFTPGAGADGAVTQIARQSNGSIVIGGSFNTVDGSAKRGIARLNSSGVLDSSAFGSGVYGGDLLALAVQADDKILIGGTFFQLNGAEVPKLVRLHADGTLDSSFTQLVTSSNESTAPAAGYFQAITSILALPDRIIVGGWHSFIIFNGNPTDHAARIFILQQPTGQFLNSITFKGKPTDVWALAKRSDGSVMAGGSFTQLDENSPTSYPGLCRLTGEYNQPDASFRPIVGSQGDVRSLALQPDGKIIAGGDFYLAEGVTRNGIARFNSNNALDTTLLSPVIAGGTVQDVLLRSDGKLVMGGSFYSIENQDYRDVALLSSTGSMEASSYVGGVTALAWYPGGKVLAAMFHSPGIRRLNPDLTIEDSATFNPGAGISNEIRSDGEMDRVNAMAVQTDGKILVGGSFYSFSNTIRQNIVRLNGDGSLDTSFSSPVFTISSFRSEIFSIALQADGKILLAGRFSTVNGVATPTIVRLNQDGTVDTTFVTPFGDQGSTAYEVSVQTDGAILVGGNIQILEDNAIYNNLVRLNRTGSRDTGFSTSITGAVKSILITQATSGNARILVGGTITDVDGAPRFGLARYLISGLQSLLTIEKVGSGSVTADTGTLTWNGSSGAALYDAATVVTLTASAPSGSTFNGWSGAGCSGTGSCTVSMSAATHVVAIFIATNHTITATTSGSGGGSVHSDPGGISCTGSGSGCSASFPAGSTLDLLATPDNTSLFTGWSGACSGTGACQLIVSGPASVTADFTSMPPVRITTATYEILREEMTRFNTAN